VKQTSSGKTRKSYLKERINEKFKENIKNLKWKSFWELDAGFAEILSYRLWENQHKTSTWRDKIIIWSCLIINVSINTSKFKECIRGEIGRHKGLKSRGIHKVVSP